ncbi:MAG: hypothetical protein IKE55_04720 [Kiritimatiellae bacterium]|nr:hypothetical protein [Kiritimatiellia bacterium]
MRNNSRGPCYGLHAAARRRHVVHAPGLASYYWSNAAAWGGAEPGAADTVTIANSLLLADPLVVESGTSPSIGGGIIGNGMLYVESGASFTSSGNISLAKTAGTTCVITNYGVMSFHELDLGGYNGGKGVLAQFDNFGTVSADWRFRLGVKGTRSIFYNHEGATFNKTGGTDWSFYMATDGGDSTIINEGTMICHSSNQTWSGNNASGKSEFILRKSGTFNPGSVFKIGHSANSVTTINLYDTSKLLGATEYRVGATSGCKGYFTLSNESSFVSSGAMCLGYVANTLGSMSFADRSSAEFNGALYVGFKSRGEITLAGSSSAVANGAFRLGVDAGTLGKLFLTNSAAMTSVKRMDIGYAGGSRGEVFLDGNASLTVLGASYIGGGSATGLVALAGSSVMTNREEAFVLGYGTRGSATMTVKDDARFVNPATTYLAHGMTSPTAGASASMTFEGSSVGDFGHYVLVGSTSNSWGSLTIKDSSSVSVLSQRLSVGVGRGSTGVLTVADNARLSTATNYVLGIAPEWLATGHATVTNNALVVAPNITVAAGSSTAGTFDVAGGCVVASNITVATGGSSVGSFEVAEGSVVSNVFHIQIGNYSTASGGLKMRGGTMLFNIGRNENNTVIWLNPSLSSLRGTISGWGKLAFTDPIAMVRDMNSENPGEFEKPGGITHYGQIIADGEGQMRDLDMSRLGVLSYDNTNPNPVGCTNGWFAVNKGRLKLPRSLPRKSANHRCVGDYWALQYGKSLRLANTFMYTMEGAELNNYMFAELYAVDRDDIPAGLDELDMKRTLAVWRIGHFSDGPEVDEPEHPAAFSSASLRFRYCADPGLLDGVDFVRVYRHDGTANGEWKCVGRARVSTSNRSSSRLSTRRARPTGTWAGSR